MKKIHYVLAIAASALFVTSCDKNKDKVDDKTPKAKTKTELLTAGKWQMSAGTVSYTVMGQNMSHDIFKDMEACAKDDFMLFGTDGKVSFDEGATKCDPNDKQTITGDWKFIDNDTKIIMTQDGFSDTGNVEELSETILKFNYTYEEDSISVKSSQTFSRIN